MSTSTLLRGIALAALLVPSIGVAQSTAPVAPIPPTAASGPAPAAAPAAGSPAPSAATPAPAAAPAAGSPAPSAATLAAADQRIRTLQSQLGITEAQLPLWTAFAKPFAKNARATNRPLPQPAGAL